MKIKEIKLFGFKSFPGETKISLDQGITAFVGPNGSGKSNIFDALRWVFGEQSMKALRCEKIEDLIYISPDTRDDANFTEVSVTIDNEDFFPQFGGEFEIKRKFYRSGESEFFLNRVKCRLQDIQALFLNSGTLTYSFLELSEIEKIIHGNTKEMFDDVSGILKYQERREQTKRRLESTEQDLLRLEDIIHEMRRSLRSLKRQVRQTRLYRELRDEYKVLVLFMLKHEFSTVLDELNTMQEKKNTVDNEAQKVMQEIKKLEQEREQLKSEMSRVEDSKQKTLHAIAAVDEKMKALKINIDDNEEKAKSIILANERTITSIKEKEEAIANNRKRLGEYEQMKEEITGQVHEIETSLQAHQDELENSNRRYFTLSEEARGKNETIERHREDMLQCRNELLKLDFERENKKTIYDRIIEELDTQQRDIDAGKSGVKQLEQQLAGVVKKQDELAQILEKANHDMTENNTKMTELETDLETRQRDLTECRVMIDTLAHRLKEKSGIKEIEKKFAGKYIGLLRDNIKVTPGYEGIVDICLGDILNYYLVTECVISDFTDIPEGRFGFIDMEDTPAAEKTAAVDEKLRSISEFVEFKSGDKILKKYLADYFIAEGFAQARELSKIHRAYGFITDDGFLFKNGLIITEKGEIGYFKVSQRLAEYEEKLETLENEILFVTEEKKRLLDAKNIIDGQIDDVKNQLFATNVKKSEQSLQMNELKRHLDKSVKERDAVQKDKKSIVHELEEIENKKRSFDNEIERIQGLSDSIERETKDILENSRNIEAEIKNETKMLNEKKLELVACKERLNNISTTIEQLNNQIISTEREIGILQQTEMGKDLNAIEQLIISLKEDLNSEEKRRKEIEAELPEKIVEDLTRRLNDIFDQLAAKQKAHEDLQNEVMQFKYQSFQLSHRKDEVWKRGKEEFKVDLRDYEPEEDIENAETRLAEIKGKLEKLGEVNPLSLDLYENEKKRLDEFLGQRDDIITAKSSLLRSIEELDTRARERFVSIFDRVKQEFNFVFSKFFEGGHADLILSDPSNPLTSKVDIVVRMKGKRLKIINQLSGGERTLLAVSLLLALYLVKPAPFCILDEIDAPLDDANVVRFNRFLRDLSQRTQVVIITHNRATMEYTDYLYGLTMEKPGQSKIISARLADLEKLNLDAR
jgi:chromosome segregation protein